MKHHLLIPLFCLSLWPLTATAETVWLSDLPVVPNQESENLGQALFINTNYEKKPIEIGGKSHEKGLTIIRGSGSWSHKLDGKYAGLSADVGQWEGNAVLRFFGDGKLLLDTGVLPLRKTAPILLDLRGVQELKISSLDTTSAIRWNTKAVIASPRLTLQPQPETDPGPGPKAGNKPPEAIIRAEPTEGVAPLTVKFRGSDSKDPDGQVGRYTWHFGDGKTETLAPDPTHTYDEPGLYEVLLVAEDNDKGSGIARQLITVRSPDNFPPRVQFTVSKRLVSPGESVKFDASASSDPDGQIKETTWDFGPAGTATGPVVEKSFAEPGRYPVKVTVTDDAGASSSQTLSVRVATAEQIAKPFPIGKGSRVLLIGNSLIGFCGPVSGWLETLDQNTAQPLGLKSQDIGKGMGMIEEYATWTRLGVKERIDEGWDVVIIQPWEDAYANKATDEDLLANTRTLVDWIRASGAFPVLYEPQVGWLKYDEWQETAHRRIKQMAETLDTGFIPAGQVWSKAREKFPLPKNPDGQGTKNNDPMAFNQVLYGDFGHQSFTGAALNGLIVWRYLTGGSVKPFQFTQEMPGLDKEKREKIQFEHMPYLQELTDQMITPGQERIR